jgi:hypothetical protein
MAFQTEDIDWLVGALDKVLMACTANVETAKLTFWKNTEVKATLGAAGTSYSAA